MYALVHSTLFVDYEVCVAAKRAVHFSCVGFVVGAFFNAHVSAHLSRNNSWLKSLSCPTGFLTL